MLGTVSRGLGFRDAATALMVNAPQLITFAENHKKTAEIEGLAVAGDPNRGNHPIMSMPFDFDATEPKIRRT